jgi:uncharacterized protein YgiM (DUF1202 family)
MTKLFRPIFALTFLLSSLGVEAQQTYPDKANVSSNESFTGKVTKNKVRIRLQPSFEGQVMGELNKGDFVLALGEAEDYYAIQPPENARGYIFRTFVLDNVIEGTRVNVRTKPDTEAPVIAQLNSGDRVEGTISPNNNKWYEVKLPKTARFYVSKDYIEKAGDSRLFAHQMKRQEEVYNLLNTTEGVARIELQKPYDQIKIDSIRTNYKHIIYDFPDFPEASDKAKTLLSSLELAYKEKKMAYLENESHRASADLELRNQRLSEELSTHKRKLETLEQQLQNNQSIALNPSTKVHNQLPVNMAEWLPQEESLFMAWSERTGNDDPSDYYTEQKNKSVVLKGFIEAYSRPVKNKPGDYMLVNPATKLPIAYLYSTQINLHDLIGHEVAMRVTARPNNNYAFPAYFVLSIE